MKLNVFNMILMRPYGFRFVYSTMKRHFLRTHSHLSVLVRWRMQTNQVIQQLRNVLRRQHKAFSTEDSYVFWLNRYMIASKQMSPTLTSEQKLEQFLTDPARNCRVAANHDTSRAMFFQLQLVIHWQLLHLVSVA